MSDEPRVLVTINPAIAYRWVRNTNAYKMSELESKVKWQTLKKYGLDKRSIGDIMIWIIAFIAIIIGGYIAVQLFGNHASSSGTVETAKQIATTIKNTTVVRT